MTITSIRRPIRAAAALALSLSLGLAVTACGAGNESDAGDNGDAVTLDGGGSTAQAKASICYLIRMHEESISGEATYMDCFPDLGTLQRV